MTADIWRPFFRGSSDGGCRGLEPRPSVSHQKTVPSFTKKVNTELEWGDVGEVQAQDLVCFEVTGLVRERVYQFQVIASNNNLDRSSASPTFLHISNPPPLASPPSDSVSVAWQERTSMTLHWLPPPALQRLPHSESPAVIVSGIPVTGYRVEVRRLGSTQWEARPLLQQPETAMRQWPQYPVEEILEEGLVTNSKGCSVIELAGLQSTGSDGNQISYVNTVLYIEHEARRIVSFALAEGEGPEPPDAPGQGGVVHVDMCFTQQLSAGKKFSIFRGYRVGDLVEGAGYAINVYAVNSAGAAYPPARVVIPPAVLDLKVVRVRSTLISLRWTMTASAKYAKIHMAKATLPGYSGGRWGAGAHVVGQGSVPPVFEVLDPPYSSPAGEYMNREMQVEVDSTKVSWLVEHTHVRVRVTAAANREGPYERMGAEITVSTARGPPHKDSISHVRLIAMTRSSFSVQWLFAPVAALPSDTSYPAFVAVEVCTSAQCSEAGAFYPDGNGTSGLAAAEKFAIMDKGASFSALYDPFQYAGLATSSSTRVGTATVSRAGGKELQIGVEYWVRVYPGNYYDSNNDGILNGSEGYSTDGVLLAADFASGGDGTGGFFLGDLAAPAFNLRGLAIDANTARLTWSRGGSQGSLPIMYKVEYQVIRHPSALASASPETESWIQAHLVAARAVIVGVANGKWQLQSTYDIRSLKTKTGCCEVYISAPRGRSARGSLGACDASTDPFQCYITFAETSGGGIQYGESRYPLQQGDTVYLVYSQAQSVLGTPLQPLTDGNITAEIGLPLPDTEYLIRVRSANLNQGGFEHLGSNPITAMTVGRPQIVGHLKVLYMSGDNAVQLSWNESQGGEYCGQVLYRLFRQPFIGERVDDEGEPYDAYAPRWAATHAEYLTQAPGEAGFYAGLASSNTSVAAGAGTTKAKFVVCSYCQVELSVCQPRVWRLSVCIERFGGNRCREAWSASSGNADG